MAATRTSELQDEVVAFVRAFGLHQPDRTPCGAALPVSDAHALMELANGPLSQSELTAALRLERSSVTRLVDRLEARGWVERARHPEDRRSVLLRLTADGERAAARVGEARRQRFAAVLEALDEEDRDRVADALRTLTSAVRGAGLTVCVLLLGASPAFAQAPSDRQRDVAERGGRVMPFDLERTTHAFVARVDGGVVRVRSDDGDARQVRLIRLHLGREAWHFRRGDYRDPAAIHGAHMPGLAELEAGAPRVRVKYARVRRGAQIRFRTRDPALRRALHRWLAAQRGDHGRHAHHEHHG